MERYILRIKGAPGDGIAIGNAIDSAGRDKGAIVSFQKSEAEVLKRKYLDHKGWRLELEPAQGYHTPGDYHAIYVTVCSGTAINAATSPTLETTMPPAKKLYTVVVTKNAKLDPKTSEIVTPAEVVAGPELRWADSNTTLRDELLLEYARKDETFTPGDFTFWAQAVSDTHARLTC